MALNVEDIYRRYGPMVLRRCRFLLREEQAAVDAMHDVFVLLLQRRDVLVDSAPSSLLYRMATQVSLNHLRRRRRHPEDPEDLAHQIAVASDEERAEARSLLKVLFSREQESTGVIAVLFLLDRMTLEEVAAEVDMSVSGVRKRLNRLRGMLPGLEVI